jgi:hypothetical protein
MMWSGALVAGEVKPPLQTLRDPNFTLIVAERLDIPEAGGRMSIRVIERLQGDPDVPDEIELLVQASDGEAVEPGETYLLFYSDVERVSFKPRTEVRRPDRRQLLHIEGADPAVFPDTPEMRALLGPGHAGIEQSPQYREIVIEGLGSDEPAMVDLWSAEWALRPATFSEVLSEEIQILSDIIEDPLQRPAARARILMVAAERARPNIDPWYAASANVVLDETDPTELLSGTGLSQLIYASLRVAQNNPDPSNRAELEKWLKATPPLAENAALALRAINPDLEREAVLSAIADEGTPETTRKFLSDHLRRAELANLRSE